MLNEASINWPASTSQFHNFRFRIPKSALSELENLLINEQPPTVNRISPHSEIMDFLFNMRGKFVEGNPGYLILTGIESIPRRLWRECFRCLSTGIGDIYPQDSSGTEIREVRDRGTRIGEGRFSRYSDSSYGGSMHTDGAQVPLPVPDYFSLLCIQRAIEGGEFIMISAQAVYNHLLEHAPEVVEVLNQPFHFDRRGDLGPNGEKTAVKPVFFREGNDIGVTYLREYIETGHSHEGIPNLTSYQKKALDALDEILADPSFHVRGFLNPGDIIFVNNKRIIHGRTSFKNGLDESQTRLLLRMWLQRHSACHL